MTSSSGYGGEPQRSAPFLPLRPREIANAMSSSATSCSTTSGTQSPLLENTGEEKALGASSVDTVGQPIPVVPDREQREGTPHSQLESPPITQDLTSKLSSAYFEPSEATAEPIKKGSGLRCGGVHQQKVGESLADKFDKMN